MRRKLLMVAAVTGALGMGTMAPPAIGRTKLSPVTCPAGASPDAPGEAVRRTYEAGLPAEALALIDCEIDILERTHGAGSGAVAGRILQGAEIARWSGDFRAAIERSAAGMQATDHARRLDERFVTEQLALVASVRFAEGADQDAVDLLRAHLAALEAGGPGHQARAARVRGDLALLLRLAGPGQAVAALYEEIAADAAAPTLERARAQLAVADQGGDPGAVRRAGEVYVQALCNPAPGEEPYVDPLHAGPTFAERPGPQWPLTVIRRSETAVGRSGCRDDNLILMIGEYAAALGEHGLTKSVLDLAGNGRTLHGPVLETSGEVRGVLADETEPGSDIYRFGREGAPADPPEGLDAAKAWRALRAAADPQSASYEDLRFRPSAHQLARARARERAILAGPATAEDRLASWRRLSEIALLEQRRLAVSTTGGGEVAPVAHWIALGDTPLFEAYRREAAETTEAGAAHLAYAAHLAQLRDYAGAVREIEAALALGTTAESHPDAMRALVHASFRLRRLLRADPQPALLGWAEAHVVLKRALDLTRAAAGGSGAIDWEPEAMVALRARHFALFEALRREEIADRLGRPIADPGSAAYGMYSPGQSLAAFYSSLGRHAEAEPLRRAWLQEQPTAREIAHLPEDERQSAVEERAQALLALARNRRELGGLAEARRLLDEAAGLLRRHKSLAIDDEGERDREYFRLTAEVGLDQGRLEEEAGRPAAAARAYGRGVEALRPLIDSVSGPRARAPSDDPDTVLLAAAEAMIWSLDAPAVELWLESEAGLASARYGQGWAGAARRGLQSAIEHARWFVHRDDDRVRVWSTLARQRDPAFLRDIGYDLASEALVMANRREPVVVSDQVAARIAMARALEARGQAVAAEDGLRETVALATAEYLRPLMLAEGVRALAEFLTRANRYDEAIDAIREAEHTLRSHFGDTLAAQAELAAARANVRPEVDRH